MADARERFHFTGGNIPLWIKILYTLFVAVLIPVYWQYTPLTFLWFCNAAVLITVAALWLESSLLAGMQALAIFWPHVLWQIDFFVQFATGIQVFKACDFAPADYMFDPNFPLLNRFLSTQHAWLMYLLLWLVWRLGYDRRALLAQSLYAWALLLLSFALAKAPGPAWNVNNVYGPGRDVQNWMPPWLWLGFLMVFLPVCNYAPLHFVFRGTFRRPMSQPRSAQVESVSVKGALG